MDIFVKIDYIDTDLHIKVDTYIIFYTMIKIDIEGKIIIEDQDFDLKVEMEVKMQVMFIHLNYVKDIVDKNVHGIGVKNIFRRLILVYLNMDKEV